LRVLIFDPTITFIFGHTVPMPKGKRIPALHTMLVRFATFLFSGLMHEWLIFLICDGPMLNNQQLLYFIVTGMMSISESNHVLDTKKTKIDEKLHDLDRLGREYPLAVNPLHLSLFLTNQQNQTLLKTEPMPLKKTNPILQKTTQMKTLSPLQHQMMTRECLPEQKWV
jgi:hypothetical protein